MEFNVILREMPISMLQRITPAFLFLLLLSFSFTACDKDDDGDNGKCNGIETELDRDRREDRRRQQLVVGDIFSTEHSSQSPLDYAHHGFDRPTYVGRSRGVEGPLDISPAPRQKLEIHRRRP